MMAKTKVVQVASGTQLVNSHLQENYEVLALWEQPDPQAFLAEHGKDVRGLVTTAGHGLKNEWLDSLPDLGVVSSFGVGYDTIDAGELKKRGIQLGNTPDVLNACVADLAVCLLLGSARQLVWGDRYVREGRWPVEGQFPLAQSVSGKNVGIVGLGGIGVEVARRLAGFDCEIRYHNRKARDDVPYGYEASLTALAEWADYLVLTCVGGPSTHHLINREVLLALGRKGTVVNVSRGTVIDETAMIQLLQQDKLGFAALDVFEHEPQVPSALREHARVTLMPHSASATVETRLKMSQRVIDNLDRFFETGQVISRVV
ncbi:2-hydroxyacid dehydrogenase [Advenella incenata]|nr:2-hydroxyacid dehydrogenase [Advenella incenata]